MSDCQRSNGFHFQCECVNDQTYFWWLPGSEARAEQRGRAVVKLRAQQQLPKLNAEMDAWIAHQSCQEPCKKVVKRVPASLPPLITVQRYNGFLQIVAELNARADVDCEEPKE